MSAKETEALCKRVACRIIYGNPGFEESYLKEVGLEYRNVGPRRVASTGGVRSAGDGPAHRERRPLPAAPSVSNGRRHVRPRHASGCMVLGDLHDDPPVEAVADDPPEPPGPRAPDLAERSQDDEDACPEDRATAETALVDAYLAA